LALPKPAWIATLARRLVVRNVRDWSLAFALLAARQISPAATFLRFFKGERPVPLQEGHAFSLISAAFIAGRIPQKLRRHGPVPSRPLGRGRRNGCLGFLVARRCIHNASSAT